MSDHTLGVVGLVVGILGLIAGVIGVWFAVRSDRKMKTAQEARRRAENKLLRHIAMRRLEHLRENTFAIMGKIKSREWAALADPAERLGQLVVEVQASSAKLLKPLDKDNLDAAALNIRRFIDSIPVTTPEIQATEDHVQSMLVRCRRLMEIASELAVRLDVELMQEPEE